MDERVTPGEVRWFVAAVACGLFVIGAVALEIVGGMNSNSIVPSWAEIVPLAWPQPARVLWWLLVAAAALGFRTGLARSGFGANRLVTVLTVGPFIVFAAGVATGADWSTWH